MKKARLFSAQEKEIRITIQITQKNEEKSTDRENRFSTGANGRYKPKEKEINRQTAVILRKHRVL